MIPIILSDGTSLEIENESSDNSFVVRTDNFSGIDYYVPLFTNEKINGAQMENKTLRHKVFTGIVAQTEPDKIVTSFNFRDKTEYEILQEEIEEIQSKKEPLTSPFTTNLEPTGVATRYYEKDELIAIYNNSLPVTVIATIPISYKQPIIIDLNCELYLGGN